MAAWPDSSAGPLPALLVRGHDRSMRVIKPPAPLALPPGARAVFLAGSIEMGAAEDWQAALTDELRARDLVVLNPRRDDWDRSWAQSVHDPRFREQVEWELDGL